jgi:hypothetical protein
VVFSLQCISNNTEWNAQFDLNRAEAGTYFSPKKMAQILIDASSIGEAGDPSAYIWVKVYKTTPSSSGSSINGEYCFPIIEVIYEKQYLDDLINWDNIPEYYGGIAPIPGTVGSYKELLKLTKGFKGAFQAHHLIEKRFLKLFSLSKNEGKAVILTKETHKKITNMLRKELPYGKNITDKGDIFKAYKKVYNSNTTWKTWIDFILY